jgi:hypothetical protein
MTRVRYNKDIRAINLSAENVLDEHPIGNLAPSYISSEALICDQDGLRLTCKVKHKRESQTLEDQ